MNILVIGASRGIGLEFVRQYRAAGDSVTATARDDEGLARLTALGAEPLGLDVSTDSAPVWPAGRFATVVINAGVYGPRTSALQAPTAAEFDAVMHANVLGAMRLLPTLEAALAEGAKLAVISSRMGSIGLRAGASGWLYRASKAALNSVLKDASIVLEGRAICIALHPGWVRTDMGGAGADLDVATSVADMRRVLAGLQPTDNGRFFNHDGAPLAW
jgi:NAD(P)-dependent dehydrogenase (short-subunit alcohol dehydrogenase family)